MSNAGPLPYVLDHDAQYPTIDGEERQPRHEEAGEKRTFAEEFQLVGLLEPEPLGYVKSAVGYHFPFFFLPL